MNWYKVADLVDMMNNLGVPPDVQQFISALPNEQKQHYVNQIKQNPAIGLNDLQQGVQQPRSVDPYLPHEKEMAQNFDPRARKWVLFQLKQARQSNLNIAEQDLLNRPLPPSGEGLSYNDTQGWEEEANRYQFYRDLWRRLDYWRRTNGLNDLLRAYPNLDISSYATDELDDLIHEWHAVQAGEGSGKMYSPTKPDLVVYGPQWQNKEYNGWTVQEVRGKNDLSVEGNRMNHCVGSYCDYVESGDSRIFSIRDPKNEPHITIETSQDLSEFRQIMGNSNSEPDDEYKPMIKEWVMSLRGQNISPRYGDEKEIEDIEDLSTFLNSLGENYDEYGFEFDNFKTGPNMKAHTNADYRWDEMLDLVFGEAHRKAKYYRNGESYWGDITHMPETMLAAAAAVDEKNNDKTYANVYTLITEAYEKSDETYEENIHWDDYHEPYPPLPDPDDYEGGEMDEEYRKDFAQAEKEQEENRNEAEESFFSQIAETGFSRDLSRLVESWAKQGLIPSYSDMYDMRQKKQKSANNWYSTIK